MRVAVVYHLANPGGVTRFTHALIEGLLAADGRISIDYFVSSRLLDAGRVGPFADPSRVTTIGISDPEVIDSNTDDPAEVRPRRFSPVKAVSRLVSGHPTVHAAMRSTYRTSAAVASRALGRRVAKRWYEFALSADVAAALNTYDVVYLPFPYYIEPAEIRAPIVATFHDLNHLYFPENFQGILPRFERQLRFWTRRADVAVVSTHYVEQDLLAHYPGVRGHCSVVYVAPYSYAPMAEPVRLGVLEAFHLADHGYLLYPSNHSPHKNLVGLLRAADMMKKSSGYLAYPFVFTGFGTDGLGTGKWPSFAEIDGFLAASSLLVGQDVIGLGFVTDTEVDALTRSARLIVSTSLYEAGCGPALDAWQFGVPVAFSKIPPFLEQLDALGVEAWTFDPRDPSDIARAIEQALASRGAALEMAERSQRNLTYTWDEAARGYLEAFSTAIDRGSEARGQRTERRA